MLLAMAPRNEAKQRYLKRVLSPLNNMRRTILKAFEDTGEGIRAHIAQVEIWLEPGEMVIEQESAYVGGLLASVDQSLGPEAAVAEAIAAVELCLQSVECVTDAPLQFEWQRSLAFLPIWWQDYTRTDFRSDVDSHTYALGIELAAADLGDRLKLLDLGCGSGVPAIGLAERVDYCGVDISERAVEIAGQNFARTTARGPRIVQADVREDSWIRRIGSPQGPVEIVAANLPYLPSPSGGVLPVEVDGGRDGLDLVPGRLLDIAMALQSPVVVLNVSSLCNLDKLSQIVTARGYRAVAVVATLAELEQYAQRVLDYLRSVSFIGVFKPEPGRPIAEERQIIYALVLRRDSGLPVRFALRGGAELLSLPGTLAGTSVVGTLQSENGRRGGRRVTP
jgi:SAM-dependent methyltransferase